MKTPLFKACAARRSAAAILAGVLALSVLLSACGAREESAETAGTEISAGGALSIPVADITEDPSFYPIEVDGTQMELIAVKASDGTIRTAFNTCQVCYSSGRGYYEQSGDKLVCQNCGNQFSMDQVEVVTGGCNPWPILDGDKTVTADTVSISYDFLAESKAIFANWK